MLKTKLSSSIQIANSRNYNDAYAGAHSLESAQPPEHESTLEYDLNVIRTQIRQLKGGGSFFESIDDSPEDGYTLARVKGRLNNMELFVGATDGTDSSPSYPSSLNFLDGSSLKLALGKIDGYLGAISEGFASARVLDDQATVYGALQNLDDGYSSVQDQLDTFTLQRAYDQDPSGSDVQIITTASNGYLVIAGTEGLKVTGMKGVQISNVLDLDGSLDADVSSFDVLASGAISLDAGAASNLSTSVGDLDIFAAAELDLDGYVVKMDSATTMDLVSGGAIKLDGSSSLELEASGKLILDAQAIGADALDIDSAGGIDIDAAGTLDLQSQSFSLKASQDGYLGVAGSNFDIFAVGDLDIDAATVHMDSSSTMDLASGGAMKLDSNSTLELEAYGKLILDGQALGSDALDIDSAGGIDIDSVGALTIDSQSFSIDGSSTSNLSVTGADLTLSTIDSGNLKLTSAARIEFKDSGLASPVALTTSEAATSTWSLGIGEAAGEASRDFSNFGLIEVANALGDGYQSLSDELDSFTLQRAYDQGKAIASEDILIADNDSLNFRLAGNNASFQVSNDDGSRTLTVRDGYVQVDGYLLVTGGTTQIETTVTDSDHLLLSPIAGSTSPALKIEPAAGFTQDLLVVEEVGSDAVAFMIEKDGDAYFSNNVTMVGSLTTASMVLSPTAENVTSALRIDPYDGFTGEMLVVEEVGSDLPVFVIENDGDAYFSKNVTIEGSVSIKGGNTGTSISVDPSDGIRMETPQTINFYTINEFNDYSSVQVTNEYTTITSSVIINNETNISTVEVTNIEINQSSTTINNTVKNEYNIAVDNSVTSIQVTNNNITNNSTTINNAISNEYNITNNNNVSIVNITNDNDVVIINNTSNTINNISETINNTINDYSITNQFVAAPIVEITNVYEGGAYVVTIENNSTYINNTSNTVNNNISLVYNTSNVINNISQTVNNTINEYNISTTVNNSVTPIVNITNNYVEEGDSYVVTIDNRSTVINNVSQNIYNTVNDYSISTINNIGSPILTIEVTNEYITNNTTTINNNSTTVNNISNVVNNTVNEYNISTNYEESNIEIVTIFNDAGDVTINNYGGQVNSYVSNEYNIYNDNDISIINITNDNDTVIINNTSYEINNITNTVYNEVNEYNISTMMYSNPAPIVEITNVFQGDSYVVTIENNSTVINNISNIVYNEVNEYNISTMMYSSSTPIVEITNVYQGDSYVVTIENNSTVINNTSNTVNNNISTVYNTSTTINNISETINNTINDYSITNQFVAAPIMEITNIYRGDAYVVTIENNSTYINNSVTNEYNISTIINNSPISILEITNIDDSVTINNYGSVINNTVNEYNISTVINNNPAPVVEITNIYSGGQNIVTINNSSTTINNVVTSEYNITTNYNNTDIEIVNIFNDAGDVTITNSSSVVNNNITTINNSVEVYNINTVGSHTSIYIDDSYTSIYSPTININTTEITNIIVEESKLAIADGYIAILSDEISLESAGELYLSDSRSNATGNAKGAFRLSTTATDLSGIVRGLASVPEGEELGIIDAINALATNVGSFEKAVYRIAVGDQRLSNGGVTLALDDPNRGTLDLVDGSEGYAPDFDPSRDLEVYVNGQFMLVDLALNSFPAQAEDDCYLEQDCTKVTFSFPLEAGDTIIIKNLKPRAGEDTSW